jgi:hypothetical protein
MLLKRQLPDTASAAPAPGSPESLAQASGILNGLASGLQGSNLPFSKDAGSILGGLGKGLGQATWGKGPTQSTGAVSPAFSVPENMDQGSGFLIVHSQ